MCCIDVQCTEWRWNIPYRGGDGMYHVTMEAEVECTVLRRSVLRGNGGGGGVCPPCSPLCSPPYSPAALPP